MLNIIIREALSKFVQELQWDCEANVMKIKCYQVHFTQLNFILLVENLALHKTNIVPWVGKALYMVF